ncbi:MULTISPECIES: RNA 2',3'-cyclic phosphodiesterase [Streptomyces]|uniref:RNA 2',3'-cyclic phosphodiesterase n=1 Tax=Streptomyces solicathayae TaxID=3081768 RepID=A0ABZ0M2S5_9ACTN|nr:RNA 2',3'-cyclic phosphodiesterase [Streptomyces sp. HUAS YS2]WOX26077.1 RNA 2',3'-cyclic phosphodiesterase [Streptomyces sp. HUAS YS2]
MTTDPVGHGPQALPAEQPTREQPAQERTPQIQSPHPPAAATIRVFIALAPPDEAKDELARALGPAYAAYPRMRWNRIEDWHITLAFLGELPVTTVPSLQPPLAALAAARPPLELALRGSGHFDERVLWSGVEGDLDGLYQLATEVRAAVAECGIPFEGRPLRPHLTLARARRDDTSCIVAAAEGLSGFTGRPWRAARLHLVGSNFGRGPGPIRYRDIVSWDFEGR